MCPNLSFEKSDGIVFACHVSLFSALTPEIRHATNSNEIRDFTTLLKSEGLRRTFLVLDMLQYGAWMFSDTQRMVHSPSPRKGESHHEGHRL